MKETVNVLYTHAVFEGNSKCIVQYMKETVNFTETRNIKCIEKYMQETVNVLYTCTRYAGDSKCIVQYMLETVNELYSICENQ